MVPPAPERQQRRTRSFGAAVLAAHVGLLAWVVSRPSESDLAARADDIIAFATAPALKNGFRPLVQNRAPGYGSSAQALEASSLSAASETLSRGRPEGVAMGRMRWMAKDQYQDGWRFGGRNMWLEEAMGGSWMNVTVLKTYTFPSGRLKPRVMTKLRQPDHKRAVRYIKRLRRMGLMPYHRIQAKVNTDPAAQKPQPPSRGSRVNTKKVSKELDAAIDKS